MKELKEYALTDYTPLLERGTLGSLERYVKHRIRPGDFLIAVMSNDLREALARADDFHLRHLHLLGMFLYNEVPSAAWGSPDKVREWLQG